MCTGLDLFSQVCSETRVDRVHPVIGTGQEYGLLTGIYTAGEWCLWIGELAQVKMVKEIFSASVKQQNLSNEQEPAVYTAGVTSFASFLLKVVLIQLQWLVWVRRKTEMLKHFLWMNLNPVSGVHQIGSDSISIPYCRHYWQHSCQISEMLRGKLLFWATATFACLYCYAVFVSLLQQCNLNKYSSWGSSYSHSVIVWHFPSLYCPYSILNQILVKSICIPFILCSDYKTIVDT